MLFRDQAAFFFLVKNFRGTRVINLFFSFFFFSFGRCVPLYARLLYFYTPWTNIQHTLEVIKSLCIKQMINSFFRGAFINMRK